MRVRHLVPALGVLATLSPAIIAADTPVVTFSGYFDSILSIADNNGKDPVNSDSEKLGAGFTEEFNLRTNVTLGAKVKGTAALRANSQADAQLYESYITYQVADKVSLKAGKSYGPIGYIPAESPALWTINSSLIGFRMYGANPIGVDVTFAATPELSVLVGVYNDFFSNVGLNKGFDLSATPVVTASPSTKKNADLAYVVDATYMLPEKKGAINAEFMIDTGATADANDATKGKAVIHFGLNGDYMVLPELKVGGEFMYQKGTQFGTPTTDKDSTFALMGYAKYDLQGTSFPMAVAGMFQYMSAKDDAADTSPKKLGLQAAFLTNPTGSTNFGWNLEVGYASFDSDVEGSDTVNGYELSTELLLAF